MVPGLFSFQGREPLSPSKLNRLFELAQGGKLNGREPDTRPRVSTERRLG